ncbi:FkbM family methyltransferase [Granulicella sp. S190]|uniref:FkbM family methyltransferase n=1 Tax=Granulicella sp. S190 TaxID=1747226 RepID=UPI00131DC8DB|nr:FkbM family methyltransferase [Granulicella sp. S190]
MLHAVIILPGGSPSMAFENVGSILRMGSPLSSFKLLLIAAYSSRPKLRPLCLFLLKPFVRNGEVLLQYRCFGREMKCFIRLSDLQSDLLSVFELGVRNAYDLDLGFRPDLVIDAGGNIGLFTLRAIAATASVSNTPAEFVIFEPLPRNVAQIEKHLALNHVTARMMAGCLGGTHRTVPFYCREAIDSSFDPEKPYLSVLDVPVYLLSDAIGSSAAGRILIKLDIEGMEIEVLQQFVPNERRAVYIVGELHSFEVNSSIMEAIFRDHGWTFEYDFIADDHANFRACSPAALPMLKSMASIPVTAQA